MRKITVWVFFILFVGFIKAQQKIDLSGRWQIKLDPKNIGTSEKWFDDSFSEQLRLPGSLQEQGFEDDISVKTQGKNCRPFLV